MGRLSTMTGVNGGDTIAAQYGPSGELLQLADTYSMPFSEARTYNSRLQLTSIVGTFNGGTATNLQYAYDATGHNNGQAVSMTDNVLGETVDYQYDSLKRLISAATTGNQWGLSFSYDGFGNRTAQSLVAGKQNVNVPNGTQAMDSYNHLVGFSYDSNGNVTNYPSNAAAMSYDIENRLTQLNQTSTVENYGYSPDNRRVFKSLANGTNEIHFYDVSGQLLGVYDTVPEWIDQNRAIQWTYTEWRANLYFGSRLIYERVTGQGAQLVYTDRLGSVRATVSTTWQTAQIAYYPYGEERATSPTENAPKFGTYYRDDSGLDYAMHRYYDSRLGRFLTADQYQASGGAGDPQSWNRYAYAENSPTTFYDPTGLLTDDPADPPGYGDGSNPWGCQGGGGGWGPPPDDDTQGVMRAHLEITSPSPCGYAGTGSGGASSPPQMDCSVTLFYRPVAFGENHAYFEVTVNGFSSILEGEPERNVTVKNAASMVLKYGLNPFGKLIAVDTSGTAGDPNHPGDNPGSDKSSGSVEGGLPVCELAGQLIYDAQIFKPDKWYRPLGPNSNSFAWWLAINANGFLGKSYFQEPPNVPGWGMNP